MLSPIKTAGCGTPGLESFERGALVVAILVMCWWSWPWLVALAGSLHLSPLMEVKVTQPLQAGSPGYRTCQGVGVLGDQTGDLGG